MPCVPFVRCPVENAGCPLCTPVVKSHIYYPFVLFVLLLGRPEGARRTPRFFRLSDGTTD